MRHLNVLPLVLGLSAFTLACGDAAAGSSTSDDVQFSAPALLTCVDGSAAWVRVGDFNGDQNPDLYVGCDQAGSSTKRTVFINNGDGTFGEPINAPYGWYVLDINGDGRDDVVDDIDDSVSFGNADGSFSKPTTVSIPVGCDNFDQDWNGDGWKDALCYYQSKLEALSFNADGSTTRIFSLNVPQRPAGADVNGDGKLDIVYPNGSSVIVQLATSTGFAAPQAVVTTSDSASMPKFADIDGDGFLDMLLQSGPTGAHTYSVIHNKAGTGFELWNQFPGVDEVSYGLEDVTGDGLADIVLSSSDSPQLAVMLGKGDGTFESSVTLTGPWSRTYNAKFADLNRDGRPDLVVADGTVSVLLRQ